MQNRNVSRGVSLGILLLLGLHILGYVLYFFLLVFLTNLDQTNPNPLTIYLTRDYRWLAVFLLPGLFQWIYVLPVVFWLYQRRNRELMKGVLIGALLTVLLNGSCYLAVFLIARR